MLDPLLLQIISVGFALLFLTAAIHKFNNKAEFLGILDAYQILPGRMLGVLANLIPAIEVLLGISWLLSGLLSLPIEAVSVLSAMLLTAYTMAIAINLIRGRSYI
ncbi:MAG: MauE/DoxX family redox-associated membrane protein, partial [Gammaproteobacteria bacterium]|nr:MauE/DoxX family redox-associated membrane protein [Gammaproteobacteria bacterium]